MKRTLLVGMTLLSLSAFGLMGSPQGNASCDRECLRGFVTQYLNAMVAHNPGMLATTPNVKFTEDTQKLKLGEGLWKSASGIRSYRQDFIDVRQSTTITHVVVEEDKMPLLFTLRLKIENKKVSEVETMVTRSQNQNVNAYSS